MTDGPFLGNLFPILLCSGQLDYSECFELRTEPSSKIDFVYWVYRGIRSWNEAGAISGNNVVEVLLVALLSAHQRMRRDTAMMKDRDKCRLTMIDSWLSPSSDAVSEDVMAVVVVEITDGCLAFIDKHRPNTITWPGTSTLVAQD